MGKAHAQGPISVNVSLYGVNSSFATLTAPQPITFEIASVDIMGKAILSTQTLLLSTNGAACSLTGPSNGNFPPGTYQVGVKGPKWLRVDTSVSVTSGPASASVTLPAGDANNDNSVDSSDFWIVLNAYNTRIGSSDYDPQADLNCDGFVDSNDFNLLNGEFNTLGALYLITLATPAQTTPRHIDLQWQLFTSDGQTSIVPPAGTIFSIYRTIRATHTADPSITDARIRVSDGTALADGQYTTFTDTDKNVFINYTDTTVLTPGEYYYQIVAQVTNPSDPAGNTPYLALSNQTQYVPASNPVIEQDYPASGVYTITGFQPDLSTINYQATVTNGLLNSYKVNGHELFHVNPATGANLPIQFAQYVPPTFDFHNLSNGIQPMHTLTATPLPNSPTLDYQISDTGNLITGISYAPTPNSLKMTIQSNYGVSFCLPIGCAKQANGQGEAVTSVQNLAVAGYGFARLPGSGVTYALPTLPVMQDSHNTDPLSGLNGISRISPIRTMRFYLGDGVSTVDSAVDFTYALNDSAHPFGDGEIFPHINSSPGAAPTTDYSCWGHNFSGYTQLTFNPTVFPGNAPGDHPLPLRVNPTPPFHISQPGYLAPSPVQPKPTSSYAGLGMYAKNISTLICRLQIAVDTPTALENCHFAYYFTDYWGRNISNATYYKDLSPSDFHTGYAYNSGTPVYQYADMPFPLPADSQGVPLTGYFRLVGSLTPTGSQDLTLIKNQDFMDFGVYNALPNKAPYIHDVSDLPQYAPYILTPVDADGHILGQSDPSISRILGMRSLRVENTALTTGNDGSGTYAFTRKENELAYKADTWLTNFSNPAGIDPNDLILFGSIAPKSINPLDAQSFHDDVLDMVAALTTYDNQTSNPLRSFNPIKYWSVFNEPDATYGIYDTRQISTFINGTFKQGCQAVMDAHSIDNLANTPTVSNSTPYNAPTIIGPNLGMVISSSTHVDPNDSNGQILDGPLSWWDAFFDPNAGDGGQYIDAVGTHTYTANFRSWEEFGVAESLRDLRSKMNTYPHAQGKDIWITEQGWNWNWSADMPRLQAAYIVRRYALAAHLGIPHEHNEYYYTPSIDYANYELWDGDAGEDNLFHGYPLRGGMAVRTLNEKTAGMHYDAATAAGLNAGKYVHAVPYTDDSGSNETIIVWGNDFTDPQMLPDGHQTFPVDTPDAPHPLGVTQPVSITLSASSDFSVYDIMGNDITPVKSIQGGTITARIPATSSPVYVVGAHLAFAPNDPLNINYTISQSGWPVLGDETNYARSANSDTSLSSPSEPAGLFFGHLNVAYLSGGAAALNDGSWQYDDIFGHSNSNFTDHTQPYVELPSAYPGVTLKTAWIGKTDYATLGQSDFTPDSAAVTFPAKTIDTLVAVAPSANNSGGGLSGVRDYNFQILAPATDNTAPTWQTVKSVVGSTSEWVLYANFPPVANVTGVRIQILKVNNGRWFDDYATYSNGSATNLYYGSALRASLYELEAYGPTMQ